jgi:hypothetical protein
MPPPRQRPRLSPPFAQRGAPNGCNRRIVLKKGLAGAGHARGRKCFNPSAGPGSGLIFCTAAARGNPSLASFAPAGRNRGNPMLRVGRAHTISTVLRASWGRAASRHRRRFARSFTPGPARPRASNAGPFVPAPSGGHALLRARIAVSFGGLTPRSPRYPSARAEGSGRPACAAEAVWRTGMRSCRSPSHSRRRRAAGRGPCVGIYLARSTIAGDRLPGARQGSARHCPESAQAQLQITGDPASRSVVPDAPLNVASIHNSTGRTPASSGPSSDRSAGPRSHCSRRSGSRCGDCRSCQRGRPPAPLGHACMPCRATGRAARCRPNGAPRHSRPSSLVVPGRSLRRPTANTCICLASNGWPPHFFPIASVGRSARRPRSANIFLRRRASAFSASVRLIMDASFAAILRPPHKKRRHPSERCTRRLPKTARRRFRHGRRRLRLDAISPGSPGTAGRVIGASSSDCPHAACQENSAHEPR